MCGIYGFFEQSGKMLSEGVLPAMASSLTHRGPDGVGFYYGKHAGIGNVRLAIIDPEGGGQPFYSQDKRVVVVQNGEIFNYKKLKQELVESGVEFSTNSDTEVILHLYLKYGIECLHMLNGMFAIAIYEVDSNKLILARDRIGEKPLYYYHSEDAFYFASEIKAFQPYIKKKINYSALNAFLRLNYIPAPHTAYSNVYHVMPGHYMIITDEDVTQIEWWDLSSQKINHDISKGEWKEKFLGLLDDSVKLRLVSDVPFGAFLSGGVDSSSVVGLMSQHVNQAVKTYTIGFPDPRFDESAHAQEAATRFNTEHHCEIVGYDIVSDWADFIYFCDQPHGDVSFMPMRKVSSLAARDVKMVLTGDGADELFAGYEKYIPFLSRKDIEDLNSEEFLSGYLPSISMFTKDLCNELWKNEHKNNIQENLVESELKSALDRVSHFDAINKGLYLDMRYLLSGNNLVKPDRMAMSESLETRAPFLDYRMMEFAFQTPGSYKLYQQDKKHLFKQAVTPLIGENLAYRKKQMFTVPIGEWFKTELSKYCFDILLSENSKIGEIFNLDLIDSMLNKHIAGEENYTREIRALISIELWLRNIFEF